MKNISFALLSAVSVSVLLSGCGGDGGHYHGGYGGGYNGPPYTNSSFSYSGSFGTPAQLNAPDAIAFDSTGNIYIANFAVNGVPDAVKLDPTGANVLLTLGTTGTTANGLLQGPQGITVTPSGYILVADSSSGQVVVYNSAGQFSANLLTGKTGLYPYQLTQDSSGNFYVAAYDLGEILKFNASGTILQTIGKGVLSGPDGVTVDPSGNVYVSDYDKHDIAEFNSAGTLVKTFGNTGTYTVNGPQGIHYDSTLGILVADVKNNFVYHFGANGSFIETIGDPSGSGQLNKPYDVTVDKSGNVIVVDSGNNRIAVYGSKASPVVKTAIKLKK